MATFLRLQDPANAALFKDLNVVAGSYKEDTEWRGVKRRSWNGQPLSTQRDPRHIYTLTAEFLTPLEVDSFLAFIASGLDGLTGRPLGFRPLTLLSPSGSTVQGARRGKAGQTVLVSMGQTVPADTVAAGSGPETDRITQTWAVDLTIEEV